MKKTITTALFLLMTGCSIAAGTRTNLTVSASEPDAQIYINGQYQGSGMVQAAVPRDEEAAVLVKKTGFHPAQRQISTKLSGVGILDALGGCIFILPWIGLAFPGAWTLDQQNVVVLMDPQ